MAGHEITRNAALDRDSFKRICAQVAEECGVSVRQMLLSGNACSLAIYRLSCHFDGNPTAEWRIDVASSPMLAWNKSFSPRLTIGEGDMLLILLRDGMLTKDDMSALSMNAVRARVSHLRKKLRGRFAADIQSTYGSGQYTMRIADRKKIIDALGVGN